MSLTSVISHIFLPFVLDEEPTLPKKMFENDIATATRECRFQSVFHLRPIRGNLYLPRLHHAPIAPPDHPLNATARAGHPVGLDPGAIPGTIREKLQKPQGKGRVT